MRLLVAAILLACPALADEKPVHLCAADAWDRAGELLRHHYDSDHIRLAPQPGERKETDDADMDTWSISDEVKVVEPVSALVGKGKFDVLEVYGFIYKASYRMRFLYAQIPETCALMGQEILEESDPY